MERPFVLKVLWCAAVVCGGNVNIYRLLLAIKAVTSSETICDLYLLDGGLFVAIKTWLHDSLHWISGSLLCLLLVMISHSRFSLKRSQTTTPSTHFVPSSPSIHDSFNPVVQNSVFLYFLMFKKANSSFIRNSLEFQVFLLRCIPNCCRTDEVICKIFPDEEWPRPGSQILLSYCIKCDPFMPL